MTRTLRRITAGLGAITMLFCIAGNFPAVQNITLTTNAYDLPEDMWVVTRTGNWGDNLTWTLVYDISDIQNASGILTISGEGEMSGEPTYHQYEEIGGIQTNDFDANVRKITTKVVIESGITCIDEKAFSSFPQLKEIDISDTVTTIGANAFSSSSKLVSVAIPDSVTSIGENAFKNCTALETVTLPKKLKTISTSLFQGCTALTSVTIPKGVTSIGDSAFNGCTNLQSLALPTSLKTIGNRAFYKINMLESVTIPDGTTTLGNYAFYECENLAEVTIPESVTEFGINVFQGTKWAKTIRTASPLIVNDVFLGFKYDSYFPYRVPNGVKAIAGGSLNSVTATDKFDNLGKYDQRFIIPESVTKIDDYAFWSDLTEKGKTGITLYGVSGSYVETWAKEHEVTFKDIQTLDELYKTLDGDVDDDGKISVSDVVLLQKWLIGKADTPLANWKNADVCEDGKLNIYDLCWLKRMLLSANFSSNV